MQKFKEKAGIAHLVDFWEGININECENSKSMVQDTVSEDLHNDDGKTA